jgi:hypothetical protein
MYFVKRWSFQDNFPMLYHFSTRKDAESCFEFLFENTTLSQNLLLARVTNEKDDRSYLFTDSLKHKTLKSWVDSKLTVKGYNWTINPENIALTLQNDGELYNYREGFLTPEFENRVQQLIDKHHNNSPKSHVYYGKKIALEYWNEDIKT